MAQYVYTMNRVGKLVPPDKQILRDISLSFFPGAKIGVLGYNGSGKSTLMRIMAGIDTDIQGEARPQPGINIGYLPQEPDLDPAKDVRGNVAMQKEDLLPINASGSDRMSRFSRSFCAPAVDATVKQSQPVTPTRNVPRPRTVVASSSTLSCAKLTKAVILSGSAFCL